MRSNATTAIASAAFLLLGCTLGLFIGRWINTPPAGARSEVPTPVVVPQDFTAVLGEIQQLRESMLRTLSNLDVSSAGGSTPRDVVAPRSEDLNKLRTAVDKLSELVEQKEGKRRASGEPLVTEKGEGFSSTDALWARVKGIQDAGDNSEFTGVVGEEMTRSHFAWTRDDVFDRYGTPSEIYLGSRTQADGPVLNQEAGISLVYKRAEQVIAFFIAEGLVTWVFIQAK